MSWKLTKILSSMDKEPDKKLAKFALKTSQPRPILDISSPKGIQKRSQKQDKSKMRLSHTISSDETLDPKKRQKMNCLLALGRDTTFRANSRSPKPTMESEENIDDPWFSNIPKVKKIKKNKQSKFSPEHWAATFKKDHGNPDPHHFPTHGVQSYDMVVQQTPQWQTTCYVGNLTPYTSQSDLVPLFQNFGYITETRFQSDRGFAFIKMDTHENAAMAICQLNGYNFQGHPLKCSWGQPARS